MTKQENEDIRKAAQNPAVKKLLEELDAIAKLGPQIINNNSPVIEYIDPLRTFVDIRAHALKEAAFRVSQITTNDIEVDEGFSFGEYLDEVVRVARFLTGDVVFSADEWVQYGETPAE